MHYGGNHKTLARLVEESNKRVAELERQIEEQKQYSPFRRGAS